MKRTFLKFLPLVAAVVLAASCGDNDDDSNVISDPVTPETQEVVTPDNDEPKTVPFSITVGKDNKSLSKATLQDESSLIQVFEPGDQLVLKNGDAEVATLSLPTDYTSSTSATFSGDLTTDGLTSGTTEISVTLTNTVNGNSGSALTTVETASTLSEAFQKYGYWTSSFKYTEGETPTITLVQNTRFIKVSLPFHGAKLSVTIGTNITDTYLNGNDILAVPNSVTLNSKLLKIENISVAEKNVVLNIKENDGRKIPTNCIAGVFSVAADKQVFFSKGNLQATYNGSSLSWGFAANQWDYIGNKAANTSINGNGSVSTNGTVDLFGWVGASSTVLTSAPAMYGISNSTTDSDYGSSTGEALKSDWGKVFGESSTWYTLSKDEWVHLLQDRTTTSGIRYAKATVNSVAGLIILPDDWSSSTYTLVSTNTTDADFTTNTIDATQWSTLESAGAVFLPAAGYRFGTSVSDAGTGGSYWSSAAGGASRAYDLYFFSSSVVPSGSDYRHFGFSVRLVCALQD